MKTEPVYKAMDYLEAERIFKKTRPYLYQLRELWYEIRYRIPRRLFEDIPFYVKRFWQRGIRGYGDSDVWNLFSYLNDVNYKGLIQLRKNKIGHPGNLSVEQWDMILGEIIWTFETLKKIDEMDLIYAPIATKLEREELKDKGYEILTKREERRLRKGQLLYWKYYMNFWD
jgi:hypothetical protein